MSNEQFFLSNTTKNLVITLSPDTNVTLDEGFLNKFDVQLLQVTGGKQIDLVSNGPAVNSIVRFRQIEIVGCDQVEFWSISLKGTWHLNLNVTDVSSVKVNGGAFSGYEIHACFTRIKNLSIYTKAFQANSNSMLRIEDSLLDFLNPKQNINEITIVRSRISNIVALEDDGIVIVEAYNFIKCSIGVIKTNSFTQKVSSLQN